MRSQGRATGPVFLGGRLKQHLGIKERDRKGSREVHVREQAGLQPPPPRHGGGALLWSLALGHSLSEISLLHDRENPCPHWPWGASFRWVGPDLLGKSLVGSQKPDEQLSALRLAPGRGRHHKLRCKGILLLWTLTRAALGEDVGRKASREQRDGNGAWAAGFSRERGSRKTDSAPLSEGR